MDQYIGRFLDNRYEILEIIGTGGMAVVYKARCHRLNRLVAIKILKDEFSRDEEFRRRFHAEGEAVASLSHPNIVQVYDVSSSEHANFIVMELIDGITLKQYMEKKGTLNWKETLHFAIQIAKALEHAHSRSIVHRDIKPHNVMVLKNGSVKVTDFGIARVMSKSNTLTKEALGSVHYISPEQAKGGWVDNRSDLYSLSVVMYEMMTGRPPYDGESPVAVAIKHINGGAPMPSTLNPNIPRGLEQIIMKGMALDAKDRYASATEMLQDMDQFRMNPSIVFDFGQPIPADATIVLKSGEVAEAVRQSRTTAEKVAGQAGAPPKPRPVQQPIRPAQQSGTRPASQNAPRQPQQQRPRPAASQQARTAGSAEAARRAAESRSSLPPRKTREEIRREVREEERNRAATIAVVACSAVAIIAILIFLVVLVNGGLVGRGENMVSVPNLKGQYYDQTGSVTGLVIEVDKYVNSDEYEKGKIISHTPEYGAQVVQGTTVKVTVSLGPEPEVKVMDYMVGYREADARAVLTGMGMVPVAMEEFSDSIEKGKVSRTDPTAGTPLTEGQTVYIYISKGPIIETAEMPQLVGLDYATAKRMLNNLGFQSVSFEAKESKADKDEVIEQPYKKGEQVDLTSNIVLVISKGTKETEKPDKDDTPAKETEAPAKPTEAPEPPTAAPTKPPAQDSNQGGTVNQNKTKKVTLSLPTDRTEQYLLSLYLGGMQVIEDTIVSPTMTEIDVVLTGSGVQTYVMYINNQEYKKVRVDFDAND